MNEIDVSLCMIVKNEEEMLERCLRSVGDAVQEIVIVDTGSTDRTVEIARRHHARVASFAWCDDFAAARNASLALARGRFVLVLDADEELTPETPALIARAVRDPEASGFYMAFENPCDEGQVLRFLIVRLFVNHPDVRFENRIHEQVWPSLERLGSRTGRKLKLLPGALIRHAGYRPELMAKRGKIERNLRLFERQLDERPDDLYTWYKYGDFLRSTPRKSEALLAIGKARTLLHALAPERAQRCSFAIEIGTLYALELYERGRYHEAHEALGEDRRRYQNSPNSDYVMAGVALKIGKLDEAQELFRRCLAAHGAPMFNARRDGITTYLAMTGLGSVAAARGDLPEASRWFERALASEPECESALAALAGCHFQAGKLGEAIGVLTQHLEQRPQAARVWLRGASMLLAAGMVAQARTWLDRSERLLPDHPELPGVRGLLCTCEGDYPAAKQSFAARRHTPECSVGLLLVHQILGEPVDLEIDAKPNQIEALLLECIATLLRCQRFDAVTAFAEHSPRLAAALPGLGAGLERLLEQWQQAARR